MKRKQNRLIIFFAIIVSMLLLFLFKARHRDHLEQRFSNVTNMVSTLRKTTANSEINNNFTYDEKNQISQKTKVITKVSSLNEKEIAEIRSVIKINLSAMYGAEKAFHSQYKRYSTDLVAIGVKPIEQNLDAKFGFIEPLTAIRPIGKEDPRILNSDYFVQNSDPTTRENFQYKPSAEGVDFSNLRVYCKNNCTADESNFEILAAAELIPGNPPDVWMINQKKKLIHLQDGLKK